jgi:RNA polymerase sigma-70 factor, ECF subfamily
MRLRDLCLDARAAWPQLKFDEAAFLSHVGRGFKNDRLPAEDLAHVHAADALLAWRCAERDPIALSELERKWLAHLQPAMRRLEKHGLSADDALQLLRERLLVPKDGRAPKIAQYAGRGSLQSWLKTAALRTAMNLARDAGAAKASGDEELIAASAPGQDVELDYIQARYRDIFRSAFQDALNHLSKRQRSLLRFQVLNGLSVDQIGGIYKVHRATAARWLAETRELLLHRTRTALSDRLGLETTELDSMMKLFGSRLDLSITGFLAKTGKA